jgi:hypothetical protein
MLDSFSESSITELFHSIYRTLRTYNPELIEIWCEPSDIDYFLGFDQDEIKEVTSHFDFLTMKRGNYIDYVAINKILFIIRSLKYLQLDIAFLSNLLDYDGFEALVKLILTENNYYTTKNFRFSDRTNFKLKTKQTKYEIDVIGITKNIILLIDCKQWKRKDSYSAMNKAANLQFRRALALKNNHEILSEMIELLVGIKKVQKLRPPLLLVPVMVTLESNWIKINDNSVPIVDIYRFNSFLQELYDNLYYFKVVNINKFQIQKQLI